MITLNMRLTAKPGREAELASAIQDKWMKAMSGQPGFIRGVMLKPYEGEDAAKVGLPEQDFTLRWSRFGRARSSARYGRQATFMPR